MKIRCVHIAISALMVNIILNAPYESITKTATTMSREHASSILRRELSGLEIGMPLNSKEINAKYVVIRRNLGHGDIKAAMMKMNCMDIGETTEGDSKKRLLVYTRKSLPDSEGVCVGCLYNIPKDKANGIKKRCEWLDE